MTEQIVRDVPDLSASQIKLYQDCEARWGAKYLGGLAEEETKALTEGKADHAELEEWQKSGKMPTRPRAKAGVPYAGVPGKRNIELPFRVESLSTWWRGFIDQIYAIDPLGADTRWLDRADTIVIRDWKTTSKLTWAKTVEELLVDPQANLYGYFVHKHYQPKTVIGNWTYLPTSDHVSERVFPLEKSACTDYVEGVLDPQAKKLQKLYQIRPKWTELEKNTDFCHSFGRRCPHFEACQPAQKRVLSILGDPNAMADFKSSLSATFPAAERRPPPPPPRRPPPTTYVMKNEIPEGVADYRPEPEVGFVNPGGGKLAATPEEAAQNQGIAAQQAAAAPAADDLDGMGRDALKALAIELGACDEKCRSREPALRDMVRAKRTELALKGEAAVDKHADFGLPGGMGEAVSPPDNMDTEADLFNQTVSFNPHEAGPLLASVIEAGVQEIDRLNAAAEKLFAKEFAPEQFVAVKVVDLSVLVELAHVELSAAKGVADWRQIPYTAGGDLANAVSNLFTGCLFECDVLVFDDRTAEGLALKNTLLTLSRDGHFVLVQGDVLSR